MALLPKMTCNLRHSMRLLHPVSHFPQSFNLFYDPSLSPFFHLFKPILYFTCISTVSHFRLYLIFSHDPTWPHFRHYLISSHLFDLIFYFTWSDFLLYPIFSHDSTSCHWLLCPRIPPLLMFDSFTCVTYLTCRNSSRDDMSESCHTHEWVF